MSVGKSDTFLHYNEISHFLKRNGLSLNQTLLKDCLQALMQTLMDIEVSQILDASRYERNNSRRAYRNGYRSTIWNTVIGNIELRVPKLRRGTYYPDQLLNDFQVSDLLLELITVCILQGTDEKYVSEILSALNFMDLSAYEIHQVCDVIRLYADLSEPESSYNGDIQRLPITYQRQRLLNHRHNEDSEFWHDFARRLIEAGLIVESDQSVLASVNPYALLECDDSESILQADFAQYIYPLYEEDYLWIA